VHVAHRNAARDIEYKWPAEHASRLRQRRFRQADQPGKTTGGAEQTARQYRLIIVMILTSSAIDRRERFSGCIISASNTPHL
jgi:hypothetical protein